MEGWLWPANVLDEWTCQNIEKNGAGGTLRPPGTGMGVYPAAGVCCAEPRAERELKEPERIWFP